MIDRLMLHVDGKLSSMNSDLSNENTFVVKL